ncbi:MAG: hypothetical protein LZF85_11060, partial [Nitrosomonas sp.]|uniref:hypothetical protein n=1 Tax=Nitrosomonas sp. TaxID=42353 RepID=UPI0025CC3AF0
YLQHTWEAYHFIGFVKKIFEVDYRSLMKEFWNLINTLNISTYGDFRRLPSENGFTLVRAEALFKGIFVVTSNF